MTRGAAGQPLGRMQAPLVAPSWPLLRESLVGLDLVRLAVEAPGLAREPRGTREPVLVLPGFGASDASTAMLRGFLGWLGYSVRGWGLGTNRGDVRTLVPRVLDLVRAFSDQTGQRVRLIGWSLGGTLVREAAREAPERVERVVTLGTPAVGGPKYTLMARFYRGLGEDLDAIEAAIAARERVPIRVPLTVIYSRGDGVVAWQACIDHTNPDVEHVEVASTHLGLGFHAEVWRVIARRLARRRNREGCARPVG